MINPFRSIFSNHTHPVLITDSSGMPGGGYGGGFMAMTTTLAPSAFKPAGSGANHGSMKEVGRVRTEFPETWLWNSVTVGYVIC